MYLTEKVNQHVHLHILKTFVLPLLNTLEPELHNNLQKQFFFGFFKAQQRVYSNKQFHVEELLKERKNKLYEPHTIRNGYDVFNTIAGRYVNVGACYFEMLN